MKRSLVVTGLLGAGLYVGSALIPLLAGEKLSRQCASRSVGSA